jgi:hypothetical protein
MVARPIGRNCAADDERETEMSALAKARANAQASANRAGRPVAILNLNRVGAALSVVRQWDSTIAEDRAFVERVEPQAAVWRLADDDATYAENAGKFILTTPDGENELSGDAVFSTEDEAAAFAAGQGWTLVPPETA